MNIPEDFILPQGYIYVEVPRNAYIDTNANSCFKHEVKYRWDWFKILISIVQSGYSSYSIYRVTQHQLIQFGYAAFGLTVAPYAIMGILNLLATLITPEFDEVYLVESVDLIAALQGTGYSTENLAIVGKLVELVDYSADQQPYAESASMIPRPKKVISYQKAPHPLSQWFYHVFSSSALKLRYNALAKPTSRKRIWFLTILSAASVAGVYGVVYIISKADPGQSTLAERIWTMGWLLCGTGIPIAYSIVALGYNTFISGLLKKNKGAGEFSCLSFLLSLFTLMTLAALGVGVVVFPVGGIVAVSQMILAYGSCNLL
jgi:hypothetical protein